MTPVQQAALIKRLQSQIGEYALHDYKLSLTPPKSAKREANNIYIKHTPEGLAYEVVGADKTSKSDVIPWHHLPHFPKSDADLKNNFSAVKNQFFQRILNHALQAGHAKVDSAKESAQKVAALLEKGDPNYQWQNILYKDAKKVDAEGKQNKFIELAVEKLAEANRQPSGTPPKRTITLKELLGSDGAKLFKAAMKEESQNPDFLNALLLRSHKQYEGAKITIESYFLFDGPSSSGKTFAAEFLIEKLIKDGTLPTDPTDQSGNDFISVDASGEREISQMRQLALLLALKLGFSGIEDLDKVKFRSKKTIEEVALGAKHLHIVKAETYADPFKSSFQAADLENKGRTVIYSEIRSPHDEDYPDHIDPDFKDGIAFSGAARAFSTNFDPEHIAAFELEMNNRSIGIESKKYSAGFLDLAFEWGVTGAIKNRNNYLANSRSQMYIPIYNDRILVCLTEDINGKFDWRRATKEDPRDQLRLVTERDLKAWEDYKANEYRDPDKRLPRNIKNPDAWLKVKFARLGPTPPLVDIPLSQAQQQQRVMQQEFFRELQLLQTYAQLCHDAILNLDPARKAQIDAALNEGLEKRTELLHTPNADCSATLQKIRDANSIVLTQYQIIQAQAQINPMANETILSSHSITRGSGPTLISRQPPPVAGFSVGNIAELKNADTEIRKITFTLGQTTQVSATIESRTSQDKKIATSDITKLDDNLDTIGALAKIAASFKDKAGNPLNLFGNEESTAIREAKQFFSAEFAKFRSGDSYGVITQDALQEILKDKVEACVDDDSWKEQLAILSQQLMGKYTLMTKQANPPEWPHQDQPPFPSDAFLRLARHHVEDYLAQGGNPNAALTIKTACWDPNYVEAVMLYCASREPRMKSKYDQENGWDVPSLDTNPERVAAFKSFYNLRFKPMDDKLPKEEKREEKEAKQDNQFNH